MAARWLHGVWVLVVVWVSDGADFRSTGGSTSHTPREAYVEVTCKDPPELPSLTAERVGEDFVAGLARDTFVYFYKDGCPFCKLFSPVIGCVVKGLAGSQASSVAFLRFEGPSHPDLRDRFAVTSYPTLRYFPKGFVLDASYFGKELEGRMYNQSHVRAFVRSVLGKTVQQLVGDVPAAVDVDVRLGGHGVTGKGAVVVAAGQQAPGFSQVTLRRSVFYVRHGDRTVSPGVLCTSADNTAAAAAGDLSRLCLAVNATDNICRPTVRSPRDVAQRTAGGQVVWYNCQQPGMCRLRATIHAAPPVVMRWTKVCSTEPVPGLDVGTVQGSPDVAKGGKVTADWLPTAYSGRLPAASNGANMSVSAGDDAPPLPRSVVHAGEAETTFYVEIGPGDPKEPRIHLHALHVGIWAPPAPVTGERLRGAAPPLLTVEVLGPVPRDTVALTRFGGRRGVQNAARGRAVRHITMSSSAAGHDGVLAVDGDTGDTLRGHLACAVSGLGGLDPEPFWEVDLGKSTAKTSIVKSVVVWNTPAVDSRYRLVPFWVLLSAGGAAAPRFPRSLGAARSMAQYAKRFDTVVRRVYRWVLGPNDAFTRRVRVQMELTDLLQLAQVQVNVVRPARRCPDPVPDNVDPICEQVSSGSTLRTSIRYTCNRPGQAVLNLTLPVYPEYEKYAPLRVAWVKTCSALVHSAVTVGSKALAQDVVANGVPATAYARRWNDTAVPVGGAVGLAETIDVNRTAVRAAFPDLAIVPGTVRRLRFYAMLSQVGAAQTVGRPIVSLLHPALADPVVDTTSLNTTMTDIPKWFDVVFRCRAQGDTVVQVSVPLTPSYQPYQPLVFQFIKECGGPPLGLAVHAGKMDRANGDKGPERWAPDLTMEVVRDGTATPAFREPSQVMVLGEEVGFSRFFVSLPAAESLLADSQGRRIGGHIPVPTAACDKSLHQRCRMLPRRLVVAPSSGGPVSSEPAVQATCDPPICAASWAGGGLGPVMTGELVGDPQWVDGKVPNPNNTVQLTLDYYCTSRATTVVTMELRPAFYDPVSIRFTKHCMPWRQTPAGIATITIGVLLGITVFTVIFCFCTSRGNEVLEKFFLPSSVHLPNDVDL